MMTLKSFDTPGSSGVEAQIRVDETGQLRCAVRFNGQEAVRPSPLGITIDGVDLGRDSVPGEPIWGERDETYPVRGVHALARDRCRTLTLPLTHRPSGRAWTLEARAFSDGFAYRYLVPAGPGEDAGRTVTGEASAWALPEGSQVWIAERNNDWKLKSYAGWWVRASVDALPSLSSQGPVQAPPIVVELPGAGGFAAITEAALRGYSGMRLRAVGDRTLQADFTEGDAGFTLFGKIISPWRVVLLSPDLNGLVNTDVLTNLNPPPDPALFASTDWIKPGRAVWRWWSNGTGTPGEERAFADSAREMSYEYTLVDDGWEAWANPWEEITALCGHAAEIGVGVLVWKDYKEVWQPGDDYAVLQDFLDRCQKAGVVGVKIDFMNAESRDRIEFQQAALCQTAERRLLLFFHGCQKPTGEARTFPHEITREGIRGLELNKMAEGPIPAAHNAALPFTRFVAGHADYTPVGFSNPGPTTWGHQLATAVLFTSPLQVIAEHPDLLLRDPRTRPALELLRQLPTVWDETCVLAPSAIGEQALFARRKGDQWWVAVLTGDAPFVIPDGLPLSFLAPDRRYRTVIVTTGTSPRSLERQDPSGLTRNDSLPLALSPADGWVAVLTPE
ncbi:MAG: glycoside hydrolase family 97 catalytic domain-containing protein [Cytophagales bacterium]|nr:glycoside hydrolase family 97 catalytic domain-containing protein [Armatimonadota bacterium]